jgi:CO/xanthine dehydrogenase FAD-binding subunit
MGGVAPAPMEVRDAQAALIGGQLDAESIERAAEACYTKARPLDNTDLLMYWRKQMARPFVLRALEDLKMQ